jgi:outer membrane protein assembly factor BamB
MKFLPALSHWILLSLIYSLSVPSQAQEWTRFRGPNGTGLSTAQTIPIKWAESDFNWKLDLPGPGHSSPVLWGDKMFLTCTKGREMGDLLLLCVSAEEGKVLWQKEFPLRPFRQHRYNSFAASSPAVDSDRVYICWTSPEQYMVVALDHSGRQLWQKNLGPFQSEHGGGASPMVFKGKVYLSNEQDGPSSILALDAESGQILWRTSRQSARAAYCTPCVYQPPQGGDPQILFSSQAHGIYAVDPNSGQVLWEYQKAFDKRNVSSPIVSSGLVFASCGSGGGGNYVVAVKPPTAPGESPQLAYEVRRSAPYVPISVTLDNLIFLWSDGGIVTCLHAPSGDVRWQERVGGNFFASPICVDGKLYCISTTGEVVVLRASDEFKILARNPLGELSRATPAIVNGRMYLRTVERLYSIGGS